MSMLMNFAPLSSAPSTARRIAAGYFTVGGVLTLALMTVGLTAAASGNVAATAALSAHPFGPVLRLLIAVAWLWTGSLLARGSRAGGVLALLFVLLPLLRPLMGQPLAAAALAASALGGVLVLVAWRELRWP